MYHQKSRTTQENAMSHFPFPLWVLKKISFFSNFKYLINDAALQCCCLYFTVTQEATVLNCVKTFSSLYYKFIFLVFRLYLSQNVEVIFLHTSNSTVQFRF